MTEEDTFKAPCKPTYGEMANIWVSSELYKSSCSIIATEMEREEYLRQLDIIFHTHGWSVEEYSNHFKHHHIK